LASRFRRRPQTGKWQKIVDFYFVSVGLVLVNAENCTGLATPVQACGGPCTNTLGMFDHE
jgi:hypothetical protein